MTFRRGGRDSSVSSQGSSVDRRRDRSDSRDYESIEETDTKMKDEGSAVPPRGMMVKGKVTRITNFGAFVRVPGYMDGLVHVTRMDDSGRRMFTPDDVRKHMKEGDEIFAKVYISLPNKYSLDFRFVNQATGQDLDPMDTQRDALENREESQDKHGDRSLELPPVNKVFYARIHSITKFGCFVELLNDRGDKAGYKHGLLPKGKTFVRRDQKSSEVMTPTTRIEDSYQVGDEMFVKVVEIQTDKGKYNVDMRYVDQKNGEDLDPSNTHSSDKTAGITSKRAGDHRSSRRSSRSRSRSIQRRHRSYTPERRERSRSVRRSYRDDRRDDRRDSRAEPVSGGFSFYGSSRKDEGRRRERSPSEVIIRRRR